MAGDADESATSTTDELLHGVRTDARNLTIDDGGKLVDDYRPLRREHPTRKIDAKALPVGENLERAHPSGDRVEPDRLTDLGDVGDRTGLRKVLDHRRGTPRILDIDLVWEKMARDRAFP